MTAKPIILCADDYGQSPAISAGILDLAESGRISATSCMSAARYWPEAAQQLCTSGADIDVGLHFTLVGEAFLDSSVLGTRGAMADGVSGLIRAAYLRRLDKTVVTAALERQLDRFEQHLGRLPDFIDGHQHIHQLPVIRDALMSVCRMRFKEKPFYIRSLSHIVARQHAAIKSRIIQLLGARSLARLLRRYSIAHNPDFSGIYGFDQDDYRRCMRDWLGKGNHGALIMCHPGHAAEDVNDPITHSRLIEYRYLNSEEFTADCREQNVHLVRGQAAGWR